MAAFFKPLRVGALTLPNRIIMAPLTRCRATPGTNAPNALMAEMYAKRADAGLLVAEATVVAEEARGFPNTPGAYTAEQTAGWRLVTDAVHAKGGRIFLQLWHLGRAASMALNGGLTPLAPSACAEGSWVNGMGGAGGEARAATLEDISRVVESFRQCAKNAKEANFDGVEVHSANGYLLHQFLSSNSNARTDAYGGSVQNRARFMEQVLDACIEVWGAERVGIRLSPSGHWQDMHDADPVALYSAFGRGGGPLLCPPAAPRLFTRPHARTHAHRPPPCSPRGPGPGLQARAGLHSRGGAPRHGPGHCPLQRF